mmetsp:Transcript_15802/g.23763  ORF Transcript_15802/g.23763 Transcript_15802/m.23763 type:complete len:1531 (+) Transcript_15802:72-4664(+)
MLQATNELAGDLEERMRNLIQGYEHLEAISTQVPVDVLNMASTHRKNLAANAALLSKKDHDELAIQDRQLSQVRNDLTGMAYERAIIDVITRDAVLAAKRGRRKSNKENTSMTRKPVYTQRNTPHEPSSSKSKSTASRSNEHSNPPVAVVPSVTDDDFIPIPTYRSTPQPPTGSTSPDHTKSPSNMVNAKLPGSAHSGRRRGSPSARMVAGAVPQEIAFLKTKPFNSGTSRPLKQKSKKVVKKKPKTVTPNPELKVLQDRVREDEERYNKSLNDQRQQLNRIERSLQGQGHELRRSLREQAWKLKSSQPVSPRGYQHGVVEEVVEYEPSGGYRVITARSGTQVPGRDHTTPLSVSSDNDGQTSLVHAATQNQYEEKSISEEQINEKVQTKEEVKEGRHSGDSGESCEAPDECILVVNDSGSKWRAMKKLSDSTCPTNAHSNPYTGGDAVLGLTNSISGQEDFIFIRKENSTISQPIRRNVVQDTIADAPVVPISLHAAGAPSLPDTAFGPAGYLDKRCYHDMQGRVVESTGDDIGRVIPPFISRVRIHKPQPPEVGEEAEHTESPPEDEKEVVNEEKKVEDPYFASKEMMRLLEMLVTTQQKTMQGHNDLIMKLLSNQGPYLPPPQPKDEEYDESYEESRASDPEYDDDKFDDISQHSAANEAADDTNSSSPAPKESKWAQVKLKEVLSLPPCVADVAYKSSFGRLLGEGWKFGVTHARSAALNRGNEGTGSHGDDPFKSPGVVATENEEDIKEASKIDSVPPEESCSKETTKYIQPSDRSSEAKPSFLPPTGTNLMDGSSVCTADKDAQRVLYDGYREVRNSGYEREGKRIASRVTVDAMLSARGTIAGSPQVSSNNEQTQSSQGRQQYLVRGGHRGEVDSSSRDVDGAVSAVAHVMVRALQELMHSGANTGNKSVASPVVQTYRDHCPGYGVDSKFSRRYGKTYWNDGRDTLSTFNESGLYGYPPSAVHGYGSGTGRDWGREYAYPFAYPYRARRNSGNGHDSNGKCKRDRGHSAPASSRRRYTADSPRYRHRNQSKDRFNNFRGDSNYHSSYSDEDIYAKSNMQHDHLFAMVRGDIEISRKALHKLKQPEVYIRNASSSDGSLRDFDDSPHPPAMSDQPSGKSCVPSDSDDENWFSGDNAKPFTRRQGKRHVSGASTAKPRGYDRTSRRNDVATKVRGNALPKPLVSALVPNDATKEAMAWDENSLLGSQSDVDSEGRSFNSQEWGDVNVSNKLHAHFQSRPLPAPLQAHGTTRRKQQRKFASLGLHDAATSSVNSSDERDKEPSRGHGDHSYSDSTHTSDSFVSLQDSTDGTFTPTVPKSEAVKFNKSTSTRNVAFVKMEYTKFGPTPSDYEPSTPTLSPDASIASASSDSYSSVQSSKSGAKRHVRRKVYESVRNRVYEHPSTTSHSSNESSGVSEAEESRLNVSDVSTCSYTDPDSRSSSALSGSSVNTDTSVLSDVKADDDSCVSAEDRNIAFESMSSISSGSSMSAGGIMRQIAESNKGVVLNKTRLTLWKPKSKTLKCSKT